MNAAGTKGLDPGEWPVEGAVCSPAHQLPFRREGFQRQLRFHLLYHAELGPVEVTVRPDQQEPGSRQNRSGQSHDHQPDGLQRPRVRRQRPPEQGDHAGVYGQKEGVSGLTTSTDPVGHLDAELVLLQRMGVVLRWVILPVHSRKVGVRLVPSRTIARLAQRLVSGCHHTIALCCCAVGGVPRSGQFRRDQLLGRFNHYLHHHW